MEKDRLVFFRDQAESCFRHAEEASDNTSKLRWLELAEEWQLLAAEGRKETLINDAMEYPALREVYNN